MCRSRKKLCMRSHRPTLHEPNGPTMMSTEQPRHAGTPKPKRRRAGSCGPLAKTIAECVASGVLRQPIARVSGKVPNFMVYKHIEIVRLLQSYRAQAVSFVCDSETISI